MHRHVSISSRGATPAEIATASVRWTIEFDAPASLGFGQGASLWTTRGFGNLDVKWLPPASPTSGRTGAETRSGEPQPQTTDTGMGHRVQVSGAGPELRRFVAWADRYYALGLGAALADAQFMATPPDRAVA